MIGWVWLLEACAAAAARRGHAVACCALLHDGTAVWRSQMSSGCADEQPSVTAAAAAGRLEVLAALPAQAGAGAPPGLVPGSGLWRWALCAACQGGQPEAVAALLEGCTGGAPPPSGGAFEAPRGELWELLAGVCACAAARRAGAGHPAAV